MRAHLTFGLTLVALLTSVATAQPVVQRTSVSLGVLQHQASALEVGEALGAQLELSRALSALLRAHLSVGLSGVEVSNQSWRTEHSERRLHALISAHHALGGARLALRLGGGGVWVSEARERHQAARLGLEGEARATSAERLAPELTGALSLSLTLSGPLALELQVGALYRPLPLSGEGEALTLTQMAGVSWTF